MTQKGAQELLARMRTYYPRSLFNLKTQEDVSMKLQDYMESFSKWDDKDVLQALKGWHLEHSEAPTVADIIREVKVIILERKPAELPPESHEPYVPNPNSRAVREMLKARAKMTDAASDPHKFDWYKEQYPERPEDNPMHIDELIGFRRKVE